LIKQKNNEKEKKCEEEKTKFLKRKKRKIK